MKEECVQKPEKNINLKRKARLTFSFIQIYIYKEEGSVPLCLNSHFDQRGKLP